VSYTVISTVPDSDILQASKEVTKKIHSATVSISVGLACALAAIIVGCIFVAYHLVQTIVTPVLELKQVMTLASTGDLSANVPTQSSSYDMKVLSG
jgi:nitrogen fixation/metabolism regulation signal transduction histidine kinase